MDWLLREVIIEPPPPKLVTAGTAHWQLAGFGVNTQFHALEAQPDKTVPAAYAPLAYIPLTAGFSNTWPILLNSCNCNINFKAQNQNNADIHSLSSGQGNFLIS
jgi:hypothetical protein